MDNYFTPWKRKFGVVTLFCTLLYFCGWMRCQTPGLGPIAGNAEFVGRMLLWVFVVPLTLLSSYLLLSKTSDHDSK